MTGLIGTVVSIVIVFGALISVLASKIMATGFSTTGLIGAVIGIRIVFGALILDRVINPSLRRRRFSYASICFGFLKRTGLFTLIMAFFFLLFAIVVTTYVYDIISTSFLMEHGTPVILLCTCIGSFPCISSSLIMLSELDIEKFTRYTRVGKKLRKYVKYPLLFSLDFAIIITALALGLIFLYVQGHNTLHLLHGLLIVSFSIYLFVLFYKFKLHTFVSMIGVVSLSYAFLTRMYNYFLSLETMPLNVHILVFVWLLLGFYTIRVIRSNIHVVSKTGNILSTINTLLCNPSIIPLILTALLTCWLMRFVLLGYFDFDMSFESISLYYVILFSLMLPNKLIYHLCMRKFSGVPPEKSLFKSVTEEVTIDYLAVLLALVVFSFAFRYLIIIPLLSNITYGYGLAEVRKISAKDIITMIRTRPPKPFPGATPKLSTTLVTGIPLYFINSTDPEINIGENRTKPIVSVLNAGYRPWKNFYIPDLYYRRYVRDTEYDTTDFLKSIDNDVFVKYDNDTCIPLKVAISYINRKLNVQLELFEEQASVWRNLLQLNIAYPVHSVLDETGVNEDLRQIRQGSFRSLSTLADRVTEYYFPANKGFTIWKHPHSSNTTFLINKNGLTHCVVVCGPIKSSFAQLYNIVTSKSYEVTAGDHPRSVYMIVIKNENISFACFSRNFHSSYNNGGAKFDNRYGFHDGFIGLEVDGSELVKPVAQYNTLEPQHRLYKLDPYNVYQRGSVSSILQHMSDNGIDISRLDWGHRQ